MQPSGPPHHSILCGPIAPKSGISRGGYETANRRTVHLLQEAGYSVEEYAYPETLGKNALQKAVAYISNFRALRRKLALRPPTSGSIAFHMTPLFKHFILPEYFIIRRAKRLGMRVILDLRAGNKAIDRERLGKTYRRLFDRCVKLADVVAVEGREYIPLVHSIAPNTDVFYLPNFIASRDIALQPPNRSKEICRLVYVGTVSEAKGIPDLLSIADHLTQIGVPVHVDIIGRPLKAYTAQFEEECRERNYVTGHGAQSFTFVRKVLDQSDFFVFLTKWHGEGHSNALTEAMARGCVPVATQHGFNQSTISDCGILIEDRSETAEIASQIAQIWATHSFDILAQASIDRIQECFSDEKVLSILKDLYWPALKP